MSRDSQTHTAVYYALKGHKVSLGKKPHFLAGAPRCQSFRPSTHHVIVELSTWQTIEHVPDPYTRSSGTLGGRVNNMHM